MHLNYVGEGCGSYDDKGGKISQTSKVGALCTGLLVCLAFLIGLSLALRQCSVNDDDGGFLCNTGVQDTLEAAVQEAQTRWGQLSPQDYCSRSSLAVDKRKEDFCCKASRVLCRTYMTAQLKAGFPAPVQHDGAGLVQRSSSTLQHTLSS